MIVAHRKSPIPRSSHLAGGSSSSSNPTQPNYKVQYYAEFLKRLIYQSKYLSLCKLCGEFLDELLDALKIISNKQRLLLNGAIDASAKLDPIVEEVDDEQADHTVMGVAAKVMKIQQKLEEVETNDEAILEKCNTKLKQSNAYLIKISNENEKLRAMTKDIKERMNNLQAERDGEALKSARSREEFHDLVSRFESMQQHFVDLEDNLKNITVAQDEHCELVKKTFSLKNLTFDLIGKAKEIIRRGKPRQYRPGYAAFQDRKDVERQGIFSG